MIIKPLTVGPVQANCYIAGCPTSGEGVIIDPGDEGPRILQAVADLNLTIKAILLTHAHFDHIGAVAEVAETTGAPVGLHRHDLPLLQAGGGAPLFGVPAPRYKAPDFWLAEGDQFSFGEYTLAIYFTPGHAPGHVVFHESEAGILFDGDVLFAGGIGRTDLPGCDHQALLDSIRDKLMTMPNETRVLSGHGPETTIGTERWNNPFLVGW